MGYSVHCYPASGSELGVMRASYPIESGQHHHYYEKDVEGPSSTVHVTSFNRSLQLQVLIFSSVDEGSLLPREESETEKVPSGPALLSDPPHLASQCEHLPPSVLG